MEGLLAKVIFEENVHVMNAEGFTEDNQKKDMNIMQVDRDI